jgi:hypothetical protein
MQDTQNYYNTYTIKFAHTVLCIIYKIKKFISCLSVVLTLLYVKRKNLFDLCYGLSPHPRWETGSVSFFG